MSTYDAMIIGAGPAGSSTAIALARQGARVLIVDKAQFPRDKVCGGLLTAKTMGLLEGSLGLRDVSSLVLYETKGFEIHSPAGLVNRAFGDTPLFFTSRRSFDHYLLQRAIDLGCHFVQLRLSSIPADGFLQLQGRPVTFAHVVLACGASSSLRQAFDHRYDRRRLAFGMQFCLPTDRVYRGDPVIPRVYFGHVSRGWAWVFPHGETSEIGVAGVGIERQARALLRRFTDQLGLLDSPETTTARGAWVPYGTFERRPARGNLFLVGDAAGFAEPITGEGICYAILSGILAADAIASGARTKVRDYVTACSRHIMRPFRYARLCRPLLFTPPFSRLSLLCLRRSPKYMQRYLKLLGGDIGYPEFFFGSRGDTK